MAGEEKTEKPTPQRLKKAREEGQVARSPEVTKAIVFAAVALLLLFAFRAAVEQAFALLAWIFTLAEQPVSISLIIKAFWVSLSVAAVIIAPILILTTFASLAGDAAQVGLHPSWKAASPKPEKINPINGFKQIFSGKMLSTFVVNLVKTFLVGMILYSVLSRYAQELLAVPRADMGSALDISLDIFASTMLWSVILLIVVSIADYVIQHRAWMKQVMMTKTEVKRENKENYGDPKIKKARKELTEVDTDSERMFKNLSFCQMLLADGGRVLGLYYNPSFNPDPLVLVMATGSTAERVVTAAENSGMRVTRDSGLMRELWPVCRIEQAVGPSHRDFVVDLLNKT
ncbi:flagellar biosynthetic protein FlhB/type III secretion protein U [Noviherbaspirillum humi]|uniref:Flagellar biosynthetic protein FlhB/type III secretion protein U n=1 Tax=Noviherbaspirillum humi TaxID=1688639 RepID=A0A239JXV3_9BURK|nr:EscU/YscU/HrcU family type III secretion system export apparatus switch protein [Noviherbaspirillum humi]SNT10610.1 flagellar biosynthetic protein FlhB/type III secretion protein U [Noviherbaspirillum humi]